MSEIWKYKFWGTAFLVLIAVYLLLPTFLGVKETQVKLEAEGKSLPWYYSVLPSNELNLGLDLRGGLYLELDVDLEEALNHQMGFLANDIERYILKDDLKGSLTKVSDRSLRLELPRDKWILFDAEINKSIFAESFDRNEEPREIYLEVKSEKKSARKAVLSALSEKIPGFSQDTQELQGGKYLTLSYETPAQKAQILTVLGGDSLASQVALVDRLDNLTYLTVTDDYLTKLKKDVIEQAANSVRNRIDRFGVAEASVSRQGGERLVVELPGAKNPDNIINIIKRTGKLEFRIVDEKMTDMEVRRLVEEKITNLKIENPYEDENIDKLNQALRADLPEGTELAFRIDRDSKTKEVRQATPFVLNKKADVTGEMLDNAKVESQSNLPYVSMSFNKAGAKKFGKLTQENVGRRLAIVLDGSVMSAPVIKSAIMGGEASIELGYGRFDELHKEATDLVLILREGALPASLAVATKNIIGPSLGQESIDAGMKSIMISAIGVLIFMLFYYRVAGFVANIALIINVTFIFSVLCLFQASLTLPGMAGIVLTLGMAVDANVIIFERMREEKAMGHGPRQSIDSGYAHAKRAILDSNITTFIAGLVLFEFGTGPIKGFATTLMIGIVTTLFTAIVVTRMLYDGLLDSKKIKTIGF